MGNRANIVIEFEAHSDGHEEFIQEPSRVFFYTHWGGTEETAQVLKDALEKRWRWNDESYLARIIATEFFGEHRRETGYGIAPYPPDNSYPYLVVRCKDQTVSLEPYQYEPRDRPEPLKVWTFEEFCQVNFIEEDWIG